MLHANRFKIAALSTLGVAFLFSSPFASGGQYDSEIANLNAKIKAQQDQISSIQQRQKTYSSLIAQKREEQENLNNQLAIIENRVGKAQLDLDGTASEITETELEIKKVTIDLENINRSVEKQKAHISTLLSLMYRQDQVSTLEILLANDSLSEFLDQAKYLENTSGEVSKSLEDLKINREQLLAGQEAMKLKTAELLSLKQKLEEKKNGLLYEQEDKAQILEETRSSEQTYQKLLAQAKREQNAAAADIANMEKVVREKLAKSKQVLNPNATLNWPVTKNIITSSFHDPDYPFRKSIGEHPAIDIKAAQGSTLRSAADGYVARVKFDGNKNYAYIMIIHGNGLSTVYGHVSAVNVEADQYVKQGQVIGRTGGMPGSIGSGAFCTGPHLHFEVRKNGLPVNPLNYLP
ncbi:MAG: murein hydrolase activator EnvC family protein [Patescibacteria group bacterium]